MTKPYGQECILDIHDVCFFNRASIKRLCAELCELLGMTPEDLYFWDYQDDDEAYEEASAHLKGTSAVQFISTSNITIHALDELSRLYVNIFSCKPFDAAIVRNYLLDTTGGRLANFTVLTRI